jgi:ribosomal protein S12 methylthiotransferase
VQPVLVDLLDGELAIGRTRADAPEIDGLVQIQDGAAAGLRAGDFCDVRILGSDEHDLFGLVGDPDFADIDAAAARPDPLRIVMQGA